MNRLKEKYNKEVAPAVLKEHGLENVYEVPKLEKVTLNVGLGKIKKDPKLYDVIVSSLASVTGQKPSFRISKKAIAGFGVKQGMKVGLITTLRGERMYDFTDKFINIVLPRVRDFRGIANKSLDKQGNLTVGIKEHIVFPEIDPETITKLHGLEVSFMLTSDDKKLKRETLKLLGFPFKDPVIEKEEEKRMKKKKIIRRVAPSEKKKKEEKKKEEVAAKGAKEESKGEITK